MTFSPLSLKTILSIDLIIFKLKFAEKGMPATSKANLGGSCLNSRITKISENRN